MIRHRTKEITLGITFTLVISLLAFYFEGEPVEKGITGMAVAEEKLEYTNVIVSGVEFKAIVDNHAYYYIFTHDNEWYESKKPFYWEKRKDMGSTLWDGLYYLKSYNAKIYYKENEVKDIAELARKWR